MKKTFNINIAGFPFVIDEDAYNLLNNYLKTIEHAFRNEDGASELINDLESRIAELLLQSAEDGSAIITLADVEQIIARVGKPEEFVEDETITVEDAEGNPQTVNVETESVTPPPYIPNPPRAVKRLYRDPQGAMLGGVCAGLSYYIGWDVTWIRLLFVVLSVVSYATWPIVYLVLWIVVPEARTPLQRMQMMGEAPTMENIGKTVTDNFKEAEGIKPQPMTEQPSRNSSFINTSFSVITKVLIIAGLIIGIPILIAIAVGFLGCVMFLISWGSALVFGTGMPFDDLTEMNPYVRSTVFWGVLCGMGWILTLGIPLMYLIRRGLNFSPLRSNVRRAINVIWGCGFLLAGAATGMVIASVYNGENYHRNKVSHNYNYGNETVEIESVSIEDALASLDIESANFSVEEINDYVERINDQVEKYQDKADELQQKADKMMEKSDMMIKKAQSKKGNPKKYTAQAERYNQRAAKFQKEAAEWQKKAEDLLNKSEKLLDKAATATQREEAQATTPHGQAPAKTAPNDTASSASTKQV